MYVLVPKEIIVSHQILPALKIGISTRVFFFLLAYVILFIFYHKIISDEDNGILVYCYGKIIMRAMTQYDYPIGGEKDKVAMFIPCYL